MHVKEPSYTYRKEKGFAPVFLAVAAECAAAPCTPLEAKMGLIIQKHSSAYLVEKQAFICALGVINGYPIGVLHSEILPGTECAFQE